METVTTQEQEVTVTTLDGKQTKVMATVTKTDHHETDADGNPKISVSVNVPAALIGVTPGKVE